MGNIYAVLDTAPFVEPAANNCKQELLSLLLITANRGI